MAEDREIRGEIEKVKQEAESLLSQSAYLKALQIAVNAPTGAKTDEVKDLAAGTVSNILNAVKEADISKIIDSLSEDERSSTMKYLYRAMASGQNCPALLKWHEKLVDKDGIGVIMRVLVDRKI